MLTISEVSPTAASATAATAVLLGIVAGGGVAIRAYRVHRRANLFLSAALIITAMIYVGLALAGGAGTGWLAVEIAGVCVYGGISLRGVSGSSWWIVAGWALHPIWDLAHEIADAGHAFVPSWYTMACLGFDIAVALVIALRMRPGVVYSQLLPRWIAGSLSRSLPQWDRQ